MLNSMTSIARYRKNADVMRPNAQTRASPPGSLFLIIYAPPDPIKIPSIPAAHVTIPKYNDTLSK